LWEIVKESLISKAIFILRAFRAYLSVVWHNSISSAYELRNFYFPPQGCSVGKCFAPTLSLSYLLLLRQLAQRLLFVSKHLSERFRFQGAVAVHGHRDFFFAFDLF
jgi:hypothetical protein